METLIPVLVENDRDSSFTIRCEAVVDTGTRHLVLPDAWRSQLGPLRHLRSQRLRLADQTETVGEVYGPVLVKVDGFDYVGTEVMFLDMQPSEDGYEPLLGHLVLEHCGASIDLDRGELVPVRWTR